MTFQEKLRRWRLARSLSQKEMAAKANIGNPNTYCKIELGLIKNINSAMKDKLYNALDLTAEGFEKLDENTTFTFHQQQVENAGQIINASKPEDLMKILETYGAPFLKHIEHLEGEVAFLRELIQRKN